MRADGRPGNLVVVIDLFRGTREIERILRRSKSCARRRKAPTPADELTDSGGFVCSESGRAVLLVVDVAPQRRMGATRDAAIDHAVFPWLDRAASWSSATAAM